MEEDKRITNSKKNLMKLSKQIAKHFREVYFGNNWTDVNLKDVLSDVNWQQAISKVQSFNTIAALVYHINYFVSAILQVLEGLPLNAHDKLSFDVPEIQSQEDWQKLVDKAFYDAQKTATLIEQMPETKLWEIFSEEKYGNYYRNINGVIEHTHYHLGQIALIKKILNAFK